MIHAECDVKPACAVPKPVAKPNAKKRNGTAQQRAEMISDVPARFGRQLFQRLCHAQREKNIVLKKGAEGDVPELPKFRDGAGEKRACKIFRQGNAENLRGAERGIH